MHAGRDADHRTTGRHPQRKRTAASARHMTGQPNRPRHAQCPRSGAERLIEARAKAAAHVGREPGEVGVREEVVDTVMALSVRLSHAATRPNALKPLDAQPT